jgi:hypothetical protein
MNEKERVMEEMDDPTAWVAGLCEASDTTCPSDLLEEVMADPRCDAFGPIHHFIVGAVLLTCYRNALGGADRDERLQADLEELRQRSAIVPGAACAYWGVCGAAASAGMAHAIIRGNGPLRKEGWSDGQSMVAGILDEIAKAGAPRCCKRDSRIAVTSAARAFNNLFGCGMQASGTLPLCKTMPKNTVCLGSTCPYHPRRAS